MKLDAVEILQQARATILRQMYVDARVSPEARDAKSVTRLSGGYSAARALRPVAVQGSYCLPRKSHGRN